MTFEGMERALCQGLEAQPPAARAQLFHVLPTPRSRPAKRIGEFWGHPRPGSWASSLLIDLAEDKAARAVVFGMLAETERWKRP